MVIRKIIALLLVSAVAISCNSPLYFYDNKVENARLDFHNGKWLLNEVDCPNEIKEELTELVFRKFKKHLKRRISYAHDVPGIMLPRKTELNPTKSKLAALK